ncbi:anthranilate phosphoribosyltransferase [Parahaliea aestuarii]|uniref:Anthranilate phosphoribosyltransferase n=1 Tax=Parahaliea aestuarii TaxID=1852021 RepID=A0A5C8ZQ22_9GAMM|nr:anthranilate phosphoribosyltransferase [Parahaliea aestuarii]TXS89441.1 anthranilate phosphoribosyltransferase [Parahaliea aestuarii]
MKIEQALPRWVEREDISDEQMTEVMQQVMSGGATDAQIGAMLVALRMKGESIGEIAAAARVMRELALPVVVSKDYLVDLVGTGGDGANLFNVSTAATFVAAAGGARMAKHGNRSVSSTSGSSDVLEALGVPLDLTPVQTARCIDEVGMGFMFAPNHHSAMRHAIGPRKELGMRTLFNILGPLTNPAGVQRQVLGVFTAELCEPLAHVLKNLGHVHALVVHAEDGLDELSIAGPTRVAELRDGEVGVYTVSPEDVGLQTASLDGLTVGSSADSAAIIRAAFTGDGSEPAQKAASLIALNAGATLYVAGVASSLKEGVTLAEDLIASGQAAEKLKSFVDFTQMIKATSP